MYQLKLIIASTRPGRKGPVVASWMENIVKEYSGFELEVLDLKAIDLPFMDEPEHPRFRKYQHQHTKDWSHIIDSADAFIIVTCEYNHSFPAPLKNAIDYLVHEWAYKPVGVISYGGVAAGTRSLQMLKPVLSGLKMVPLMEAVNIPFFTNYIKEDKFVADETLTQSAHAMMKELEKWTGALKNMRGDQNKK